MCAICNRRHNDDPSAYLEFMRKHYGTEVIAELNQLRISLRKVPEEELRRQLERYRAMI